MEIKKELLRKIPKVDEVLATKEAQKLLEKGNRTTVTEAVRAVTQQLREEILNGGSPEVTRQAVLKKSLHLAEENSRMSLRPVINATGIVLHTNLGRAVMSHEAAVAAMEVAENYNTLEYNCEIGRRGSRYDHVEELICRLTGAEAAMVVNNNAAAVMLILGAMAKDRAVVVSRGELVEIGGSFRVPEIMEQSNSTLREVGTTNKTHPEDYIAAIDDQTAALLKVHTSNYKILGFTEEVSLEQLVEIGRAHHIPVIFDLGSGALESLAPLGIYDEPTVTQAMSADADVISFSGDKLLGGPQAGIIIGKKEWIAAMKKNPLTRALRIDKLTLAALEATLRIYLDPEQVMKKIPTYRMLSLTMEELKGKCRRLIRRLNAKCPELRCAVSEEEGQVGGGSVPTQMIKTAAVAITCDAMSPDELEKRLRECRVPVIARISKERLLLDMRTVDDKHFAYLVECFDEILHR